MAGKNTAVFGIYKNAAQAELAVDRIIAAGFSNNDISVLLPDTQSTKEFAHEKNTKAPEGTTTGVATGGVIGGAIGLLAGVGALAIPGVGPFIAAGPIMGALAGLGAGGAVGGLIGALVGMGMRRIKVASGELTNTPALRRFAGLGLVRDRRHGRRRRPRSDRPALRAEAVAVPAAADTRRE